MYGEKSCEINLARYFDERERLSQENLAVYTRTIADLSKYDENALRMQYFDLLPSEFNRGYERLYTLNGYQICEEYDIVSTIFGCYLHLINVIEKNIKALPANENLKFDLYTTPDDVILVRYKENIDLFLSGEWYVSPYYVVTGKTYMMYCICQM